MRDSCQAEKPGLMGHEGSRICHPMKADRKATASFDSALEHHRAGRLDHAEAIYRK